MELLVEKKSKPIAARWTKIGGLRSKGEKNMFGRGAEEVRDESYRKKVGDGYRWFSSVTSDFHIIS